jgi:3-hydroxymyristoyl/3-hydroxydecanoyl-(acyl carrier protein) dehydratase
VLTTSAKMVNVSKSGGMIIQHFEFSMFSQQLDRVVYEGTSYFGFFSAQSLADQVGVRDVEPHSPTATELAEGRSFAVPRLAPMPNDTMRMVDEVDLFAPSGGRHGLGFIRGSKNVDPGAWFFLAHFYQDPVWPGSLGLESYLQLLKVVAIERWNLGADAVFATAPSELRHSWVYRGQVTPGSRRVEVEAHVKEVDDERRRIVADGMLVVDGRPIYTMADIALEVRPKP